MAEKQRTPNDDRSDGLNPNAPDRKANLDNHSQQLDPNNPKYQQSRQPESTPPKK